MRRIPVAIAAFLIVPELAGAQSAPPSASADADFLRGASSAGLTQIALGELAADRASSKDVKEFAEKMVQDNTRNNEALGKLAGTSGLQVAAAPEPRQQQTIDELKALQGASFDRAYSDAMVRDHKLVSGLYELEARKGEDPAIRKFAADTLPMIDDHLKSANALPPL